MLGVYSHSCLSTRSKVTEYSVLLAPVHNDRQCEYSICIWVGVFLVGGLFLWLVGCCCVISYFDQGKGVNGEVLLLYILLKSTVCK